MKVPYDFIVMLMKDLLDYLLEVGLAIDLPAIGTFTILLTIKGAFREFRCISI